jgi:hypothetical protein
MKRKLALNFKETRDSDLYGLACAVVQKMTENEHFPDPGMLIIELEELKNQFRGAMTDAALKDREKIAYKNNVKVSLIQKLKQVGEFVLVESKGAELPMITSGFSLYKPVDEITLKKPAQFRITPGKNPGEMIMQVRRVKGARSYLYQWTPFPITSESVWESVVDTRCKKVISKLPLGVQYCFRMAAVGAHKQIIYTEPLYRYIS